MVTKGIITSIDFNGNTCQVRIPLFETSGNDPITGTAIVSNTPGSYNGYKVGDAVLVAFEDGKMQNPVIVGKLYLGAAKEKQDPRGTINVETTTVSKSASLPADAVLTANVDSNVPNTNTPFGSLTSIANNLNSLNTDVNQLDRFTRNQFNSVITDVNDQGEQLRSEIKQTAENIEANVVHKHQDGSQDALGWDLDVKEWKINAQDTVNGKVKDINIVTIDRSGMSIAGDLKLSGYPKNTTIMYAQNDSDESYPTPLYNFTEAEFPTPFPSGDEDKDKTWYYGKYIKIEENYVLIFKENFEHYKKFIDLGTTKAYSREINPEWKTETPARVDGKYIWQWTHTESYSFDGDKWNEQDDDKVVCITGAKGDAGKDGYNTVTVMLYKRSKTSVPDNPVSDDLYYKFSDQKLYTNDTCITEYTLPTGWSYTISGAGDSGKGDLYCIAAVAHSNTDSDSIPHSEWAGPTLYVENGVSGTSVAQLILYQRAASTPNNPTKDGTWTYNAADGTLTCSKTTTWNASIPSGTDPCYESHTAVLVTGLGTTTVTKWSAPAIFVENGTDGKPGVSIKEAKQWYILWLANASTNPTKLTNNTEPTEPADPSTVESWMSTPPEAVNGYVVWTCYGSIFSDDNPSGTRHIEYSDPVKDNAYALAQGKTTNYYSDTDPSKAYSVKKGDCWFDTSISGQETLKQWDGSKWQDIGGELVTNKVTANYINALDITAKKITVLNNNNAVQSDSNPILFEADGLSENGSVKIANFTVKNDKLYSGNHDKIDSKEAGIYLGSNGLSIGSSFKITTDATPTIAIAGYTKSITKKYSITTFDVVPNPAPSWWDTWTATDWRDKPPNRKDGNYIWEWTRTTSTTDVNTADNTKDTKVCITGAKGDKGDPGKAGVNPYVGTNGNWWIGNDDTGVKAKGTDGHTPVIKIGENGNWYIDGEDTGVLAKGTPGEPGKTGRSVLSVTKFYKTATSKPNPPDVKEPADWYMSPPAFVEGNKYYESDRTIYDSVDGAGKDYSWSGVIENSMLTVDFIDSLGITAKKITVKKDNDNSKEPNDSNPILFQADGTSNNSKVNIGGFTVDSNRLYAGTPGSGSGIELSSYLAGLIAYKSNNQGVASSYAVSKITVNKATNLTVYIRSYAESSYDYTMISNPNVSSYPTLSSSSDVKAHTSSNQNSSSALADYTKVEYSGLKQNDWIYVVYKKDGSNNVGADTGYFLIPETADVSISNVGATYYFVRDSAFDIKGASIKVGSNFSVDSTGAIKSTSGAIGGFEVTSDDLHTADKTIGDNDSLFLSSNGITVTDRFGIGGSSGEQTWSITAGNNFGVTKSGKVYAKDMVITGDIDTISIGGTGLASMCFKSNATTNAGDCSIITNEIKNTGRLGYNIAFEDSDDKQYSASISIQANKPGISGLYTEPHYYWKQGIELKTYNPADKTSGALANNAALRIGYYSSLDSILPTEAKKARGFLGDVWCPTGIFRCKNGNIVPYIYGYKSGVLNTYSDEYEYGFYFDSSRLESDSWASWYYGDTFNGIDCVIVSMGRGTLYEDTKPDTSPGHLPGSQATENSFYFIDHINKYVYWCNDTSNTWTVDVFIVGYKRRAAGTFIGDQEIK